MICNKLILSVTVLLAVVHAAALESSQVFWSDSDGSALNGSGVTYTQADYDVWRAHFSEGPTGDVLADIAAPEPVTEVLVMGAMTFLLSLRRRF